MVTSEGRLARRAAGPPACEDCVCRRTSASRRWPLSSFASEFSRVQEALNHLIVLGKKCGTRGSRGSDSLVHPAWCACPCSGWVLLKDELDEANAWRRESAGASHIDGELGPPLLGCVATGGHSPISSRVLSITLLTDGSVGQGCTYGTRVAALSIGLTTYLLTYYLITYLSCFDTYLGTYPSVSTSHAHGMGECATDV